MDESMWNSCRRIVKADDGLPLHNCMVPGKKLCRQISKIPFPWLPMGPSEAVFGWCLIENHPQLHVNRSARTTGSESPADAEEDLLGFGFIAFWDESHCFMSRISATSFADPLYPLSLSALAGLAKTKTILLSRINRWQISISSSRTRPSFRQPGPFGDHSGSFKSE